MELKYNEYTRTLKPREEVDSQYIRLEGVLFPPEIIALPHIIKHIDQLLMSHDDAVLEATETGQLEWIKQLLPTICYDHLTVFRTAASYGYLDITTWLTLQIRNQKEEGQLDYYVPSILKEAIMNATYNGHHKIVQFLLEDLETNADDEDERDEVNAIAWKVLKTAAYSGCLEVVKHAAEYAHEALVTGPASTFSKALTNAIDRGHFEVASFLINERQYHWDLKMAFEQALLLKHQLILEAIYELDREVVDGASLIVCLARSTGANGLQSLLNSNDINSHTVYGTLTCASRCGRVDILDFLLEVDCVSEKLLDEGFLCAAHAGSIDSVEFLFNKGLLSSRSVNLAFENAGDNTVTKFLHENADIPTETINSAFKAAIAKYCDTIAIFLHKEKCIPAKTVNQAFLIAASSRRSVVVEAMRGDYRLSSATLAEVFSTVIDDRHYDMVKAAYDKERLPQELVSRKFIDAAYNGDPDILIEIGKKL
ncbi:Hypothetical protein PHPALM_3554 [Phytophthora palmivora]|uniref:Uncharacterized protein n=1 Tax=Phytophthora palmivora TaxID=4796 RepID=A0A2P4YM56_9STRA|nr:Hypothetical protein PHPALM_3554 [Phytophthora palmivora]